MVSTDIGNICSVSNSYLRFAKPVSFFAAMSFGNCGYAFPCAMGAKVCKKKCTIVRASMHSILLFLLNLDRTRRMMLIAFIGCRP